MDFDKADLSSLIPLTHASGAGEGKLGISYSRAHSLIGTGELDIHAQRVGRYWFITQAEVDRFKGLPRATGKPRLGDPRRVRNRKKRRNGRGVTA
jgi:hypothetical protein